MFAFLFWLSLVDQELVPHIYFTIVLLNEFSLVVQELVPHIYFTVILLNEFSLVVQELVPHTYISRYITVHISEYITAQKKLV